MQLRESEIFMNLFYELIQVALNNKVVLGHTPTAQEWQNIYELCQKQSVVGFAFEALDGLSRQSQKPPLDTLYQWIGDAEQIKHQNLIVNKRCVEITQLLADAGFRSCILKGQGNAMLYPTPLARTSGDIDIWIDGKRDDIDEFVHQRFPDLKGGRMHIEFPIFDDVAVEVHYIPRYLHTPWHNKRLQRFFREHADEQFEHRIRLEGANGTCCIPTMIFNIVQQMSHMMSHSMGEGIGLRQFVDYYYILKSYSGNNDFSSLFNQMGMLNFARGVMWIEKMLLGLENRYLIVEPSEKVGNHLKKIVEEGGNFGHHNQINKLRHKSIIGRAIGGVRQSLGALKMFPSETAWKLIGKIYK